MRAIYKYRWAYIFILPHLIGLLVIYLFPVLRAFQLSFSQYDILGGKTYWVGLKNFQQTFNDPIFWIALRNTAIYTVFLVPIEIAIALILSVIIFPLSTKIQSFFKAAFYLPAVVSAVVIGIIWSWIYNPDFGLLNYLLRTIGFKYHILWLGDPRFALGSIIFMTLISGIGAPVILYLASLGSIPSTYYEVAKIDGASSWSSFWHITFPLLKPTTLYLLVVATIGSFQVFTQIFVMTKGGPLNSTVTIVYLIYQSAFENFNFGLASSQAMVLFVIIALVGVIQYRYLSSDVEY